MWRETIEALLFTPISKSIHSLFTEKMDNLTKQLFDDVQKEEQQRVYEISFALKPLLPSLCCFLICFSACRLQIIDTGEHSVDIFRKWETALWELPPQGCTFQALHRFWSYGHSGPLGISCFLFITKTEVQRLPPSSAFKSKDENYCLLNKPSFFAPTLTLYL